MKARPKKERREVELYTKTAVWGEVKSSNHLQLSTFNFQPPSTFNHISTRKKKRVHPPRHQSAEQHGDKEAEGEAGHDEGAGGASGIGVG